MAGRASYEELNAIKQALLPYAEDNITPLVIMQGKSAGRYLTRAGVEVVKAVIDPGPDGALIVLTDRSNTIQAPRNGSPLNGTLQSVDTWKHDTDAHLPYRLIFAPENRHITSEGVPDILGKLATQFTE